MKGCSEITGAVAFVICGYAGLYSLWLNIARDGYAFSSNIDTAKRVLKLWSLYSSDDINDVEEYTGHGKEKILDGKRCYR